MARVMKPNDDALCALRFIHLFDLDVDQIIYRYTVEHIDTMCAEMGLRPIEGEVEEQKAQRLRAALFSGDKSEPMPELASVTKN